ncbi:hypothetical protein ACFYTF_05295 [Nocardia thailandica]|uniref:Secreted protein n=1 Tax=Nocardia thailandica TaxID=257275 RepID=A0ABW6PIX6_9NOCA
MTLRTVLAGAALAVATVVATAPAAGAVGSSEINVGCLLQALSGTPPTADCAPMQIPVP